MTDWRSSPRAAGRDLTKVPTDDLLREIGRRCAAGAGSAQKAPARERQFATKALWAKDKANQARTKLAEVHALPPAGMAEQWERDQILGDLEAEVVKFDGMAAVFERKGQ
ncbi:hypothetical protein [Stenotrophomonas sp. YIM B13575]|uniref:hypothetical protein n=1 Tax=Stenotrophomonas sp. YIM B13575 TaxID=3366314 RepID=UPI0036992437